MTITATFIRKLEGWNGDARLYRLSELVDVESYFDTDPTRINHVIVSAVTPGANVPESELEVLSESTLELLRDILPETYIFPGDKDGNCLSFMELPGSFRGALDHERAIRGAGWDLAPLELGSGS